MRNLAGRSMWGVCRHCKLACSNAVAPSHITCLPAVLLPQEALQAFRALRRRTSSAPLSMLDDVVLTQLLVGARQAGGQCCTVLHAFVWAPDCVGRNSERRAA